MGRVGLGFQDGWERRNKVFVKIQNIYIYIYFFFFFFFFFGGGGVRVDVKREVRFL